MSKAVEDPRAPAHALRLYLMLERPLSQRAGEIHYLRSKTATYVGSGKEIKGNNMAGKRKQMRTELHIWLMD